MRYLIAIVLLVAAGAGGWWWLARDDAGAAQQVALGRGGAANFGGQQAPLVVVAPVKREPLYDVVEALGTATANESVVLTARVTDTVRRVNFEDGDLMEANTILI